MNVKNGKRKWGLMVFIIIIMIGTSFSVFFTGGAPQSEVVKYNGIKFVSSGSSNRIWIANINDQQAAFSFLPSQVESIVLPRRASQLLQNKFEIDSTSNFNDTFKESIALSQHQMGLTLQKYNIYLRKGFTLNNSFNIPIITCDDATANVPVIYFRQGNSTRINLENNCVIVEAPDDAGFIMAKDRMLYDLFGVIK